LTNFVMAGVMAIAPVHLHAHGHDLDQIGVLVGLHVVAMFAPGPLSGMLVDRLSPQPVILAAAALLAASSALLAGAAGPTFEWTVIGLVALGLGWNAGVVGGSALVTASVPAEAGSQAEGLGEVAMGAAAAVGTPLAGLGSAAAGFAAVSGVAAGLAVVLGVATLHPAAGGGLARPIGGNLNARPGRQA
jgi:MFS family permease